MYDQKDSLASGEKIKRNARKKKNRIRIDWARCVGFCDADERQK